MRTRSTVLLVLALAAPLMSVPALAQEPTQAEMAACMPDFKKLCAGTMPGGGRVLACLSKNKAQLSPDCKAVVEKNGG